MRAVVELFQPYNRPVPKLPPILSMLRDFENSDKHRLLQVIFSAASSGEIGFTGPPITPGNRAAFVANNGKIVDGAEIAAFVFDRPQPDMTFDRTNFTIVFALPHKQASDGVSDRDDATTLLMLLGDEVEAVVNSVSASSNTLSP